MSVGFWSPGNEYCQKNNHCGSIVVDINGEKTPNQVGIDVFWFGIKNGNVLPSGTNDVTMGEWGEDCSFSGTTPANGAKCAGWVIYKRNLDFLNHDIKWN